MEPNSANPPKGIWALESLSFFMADVQAGLGPFLGVFLQSKSWKPAPIGAVMTIGGVAGMLVTAPAGALIDQTRRKRSWVVASGIFTLLASALVFVSQRFPVVALCQCASAIAGAVIGPALAGVTLGMVRQQGFNRQNGRNQAFNHAGNLIGAALSGLLGWKFGFVAVFWLAAAFGLFSIFSVLSIPADSIDDQAARGAREGDEGPEGWRVLLKDKPLLVLAGSLAIFHLGNAALLPLYGQALVAGHQGNPAALTALTIVVAQGTMIATSLLAMHGAERFGYWPVLLASFLALPVRGVLAACFVASWGIYPVQMLDGIGAGLQSVAVPGMVASILNGTGRVNVGQGAVMTAQGVGASLSPLLGGFLSQLLGYPLAFLILGALSAGSVCLWVAQHKILRAAPGCGGNADA